MNKQNVFAIIGCIVVLLLYILTNELLNAHLSESSWYFGDSCSRMLFGIITLLIMSKLYNRSIKDILYFHNPKTAFIASLAFLIYAVSFCIDVIYTTAYFSELTISLFISKIILQQFATGFFEEILLRGLLLESTFHNENHKWYINLIYGLLNFIIFGILHVLFGWNFWTFFCTGAVGLAFATIFLLSHNIIYPMILHFIYDIFANIAPFAILKENAHSVQDNKIYLLLNILMFIFSICLLIYNGVKKEYLNKINFI